ncbi:Crp/Fnr family transcriptional regulator [Burkholderia gladioli]|uniref:Crp/Fnr family transcriptional regulator n=1 Tax=Burkholderia gladioli TaxID=28095 RepID=UPI002650D4AE|nr:Crp/Fnr family transcriptional regulator [Burkholderia gladioli]MDN7465791.1 Crp/Fnr family transcriptional regulator [Burkholderia gladioli]
MEFAPAVPQQPDPADQAGMSAPCDAAERDLFGGIVAAARGAHAGLRAQGAGLKGAPKPSAALPDRVWPQDIPYPAPASTPKLLRELKVRLGRYLDTPQAWLPRLNIANGSPRQQRSERRVACVQLMRALVKFCDLVTLRVAVPGKDGWIDFTIPYLAEQAGLSLRRTERALRDLIRAKLIKSRQQCEVQETEEGTRYRGFAAIKYVTPALFEQFGLGKWLNHERTRAHLRAQRRRDALRKRDRKSDAAAAQLAEQLGNQLKQIQARLKRRPTAADVDHQVELERAITLRAGQLKEQNPGWDRDRCYSVARQTLSPPGH